MLRTATTRREEIKTTTHRLITDFEVKCNLEARRLGITEAHLLDYITMELTQRFIERRLRHDRGDYP